MKIKLLPLLLLLALALGACRDAEVPAPTPTEPAGAVEEATATALPPTETTEPTATMEPAATPTNAPTETPIPAAELELVRTENEVMSISVLVPEGWTELGPGVYARQQTASDLTTLIQQAAAGASSEEITGALLPQLGIEALPEPVDSLETDALTWDIYQVEVDVPSLGTVVVDLALAQTESAANLVLLQTTPDDYDRLHEELFLPAVQGFEPAAAETTGAVYEDPTGLFTVPVPNSWTVEESEQYVTLLGPDEELKVHILALEGEDTKAAVEEAWQIVDPDFDQEETETMELPASAAGGVDEFILVNYARDDDEPIVQVEGRRYQGTVYVLIYILELEALQQRNAQIQTIDTGFDIIALEEADLSAVEPLPLSEELIAELETYIEEQMTSLEVPGAAISIVRDGEVVYANGFGVRDLESQEPVTPETLMMIGSTTKPVTTMLMAQLVDEGLFDWDTPVVEILPSFAVSDPDLTEQLTMRNLVCACTGVPRRDFEWLFNASEMDAQDVISSVADFEFFTDFGETFQYSNQMVATAGYVATLAAGGELDTLLPDYIGLMQERLLGPIGMAQSTFDFEAVAADANHATPYGVTATGEMVELPLSTEAVLIPMAPAGALWSNVVDMADFVQTNLNQGIAPNGARVVSAENLAVTWEPQVEISADASYGLGWIVEEWKGVPILSHAGNTFGFTSEMAFLPNAGLGVSILTNQRASALNQIIRIRLLEMLYEQESEVDELLQYSLQQQAEARADLEEALVPVDRDTVAPYLGAYQNDALGAVTLDWQEDALVLDAGEFSSEIRALEDEETGEVTYLTFTPPVTGVPLELSEDDAGNPTIVFGVGVVEYTFEKVD